jgi:hypothetical protein
LLRTMSYAVRTDSIPISLGLGELAPSSEKRKQSGKVLIVLEDTIAPDADFYLPRPAYRPLPLNFLTVAYSNYERCITSPFLIL